MRVLHVTPYFAPAFSYGGPPRSVLGLCRGLQRSGVDVQVFTTTANGVGDLSPSASTSERYAGIHVRYFRRAFPRRLFGAEGLGDALASSIPRFDLVHIHGLWHVPGWTAGRRARWARVPYVLSPRGMLDPGSFAHHYARKRLAYVLEERRQLSRAAFLHASSELEAAALERRRLGVPIITVPNGIDVAEVDTLPRGRVRVRLGVRPDTPLIAFLARIHPSKRLDLLAQAFDRVRTSEPSAHLVIAGPDEVAHRRDVEPCFASARANVHWTGELDETEKWALLADADALILCSDSESFGMSVLEAMAMAVPVVVTQTCPWAEVASERCGFWVPQDAGAMAAALVTLLRDPVAARSMGDRGRDLMRRKYSWDSIASAMADSYRAALAGTASRGDE